MSFVDEYIKLLNQSPTVINDCDADSIVNAYRRGYLKGREDILKEQQQMKDYCKNDCDALHEAYNKAYSEGFLEGDLPFQKKEVKDENHI